MTKSKARQKASFS